MPLEDYLMPGEEIKFHSNSDLGYGGKLYELVVTDKRLLLYGRRGTFFKKDDLVSQKIDEVQNVKYRENGMIRKTGVLEIEARTRFSLSGPPAAIKTVYHQILQFI